MYTDIDAQRRELTLCILSWLHNEENARCVYRHGWIMKRTHGVCFVLVPRYYICVSLRVYLNTLADTDIHKTTLFVSSVFEQIQFYWKILSIGTNASPYESQKRKSSQQVMPMNTVEWPQLYDVGNNCEPTFKTNQFRTHRSTERSSLRWNTSSLHLARQAKNKMITWPSLDGRRWSLWLLPIWSDSFDTQF